MKATGELCEPRKRGEPRKMKEARRETRTHARGELCDRRADCILYTLSYTVSYEAVLYTIIALKTGATRR